MRPRLSSSLCLGGQDLIDVSPCLDPPEEVQGGVEVRPGSIAISRPASGHVHQAPLIERLSLVPGQLISAIDGDRLGEGCLRFVPPLAGGGKHSAGQIDARGETVPLLIGRQQFETPPPLPRRLPKTSNGGEGSPELRQDQEPKQPVPAATAQVKAPPQQAFGPG